MAESSSRKLAVILHADVVGSTALVQLNETLAHQRIQGAFRRFSETIAAYGGIAHELRGDALVAEFNRASDAVTAAIAFQATNAEFNATLDDDIRPHMRMGISLGEVVIADNTITGAGVVLAQRLEQLAESGGVCIQGAAYETVPQRLPFEYKSLGTQQVKGFEESVLAYAVTLKHGDKIPAPEQAAAPVEALLERTKNQRIAVGSIVLILIVGSGLAWWQPWVQMEEPASVERMAIPLPDKPSIAVLPFTNMSDDPEQEYFVDGMTEDLITDLSKLSGLFVIARNSVFTYKGKAVKVSQVAHELGVRYVLEGSVRRAGDKVRINAQLIDGNTGGHIWAERYDGSLVDVFRLQDQVTDKIVTALKIQLTPQDKANAAGKGTTNIAAYDSFLKGREHLRRKTPEDDVMAVAIFKKATELDPNYGRAYAAMAQVYWDNSFDEKFNRLMGSAGQWGGEGFGNAVTAWEFLQKSVDTLSPLAHALAARMLQRQRRFEEAMHEARQAVLLGPSDPIAYEALIENLIYAGETVEALRLIDVSIGLEPRFPGQNFFLKSLANYTMRRLPEALSAIERARAHNPRQTRYAAIHAVILAELGRVVEAKVAFEEYRLGVTGFVTLHWTSLNWPFNNIEQAKRLAMGLLKAGMQDSMQHLYAVSPRDRLRRDKIRALLATKTMIGMDRGPSGGEEFLVRRDQNVQIVSQEFVTYFREGTTKTRIENDLLCDPWRDFGDYCVAIYRNPEGAPDTRDEYLFFTLFGIYSFSVFDSVN